MDIQELSKRSLDIYNTRDQLTRFVYGRSEAAFSLGDERRDRLGTIGQIEKHKRDIRAWFLESIGGLPDSDHPLNPRTVGVVQEEGFRIEKVIFESRPHTYITANLYIPDAVPMPTGGVLFLCGHHRQAKHEPEYQSVCRHLVMAGLVVLAQDPIGQGERLSYYEPDLKDATVEWGTKEHDYAGSLSWLTGTGLARYFLQDAMRGFDYLASRPEVDPKRIGVTGNSGGGTQTSLMLLGDPRIAAAVPATFIMDRRSYLYTGQAQDAEQIWPGMTSAGFDHEDILLAASPKPILVLAVAWDFFPIEGTLRTVRRCGRYWSIFNEPEALRLFIDRSDHHYTVRMAKEAARFFARHLCGREIEPADIGAHAMDPKALWCTPEGQVRARFPDARGVFEENLSRAQAAMSRRNAGNETGHESSRAWLRSKVFAHRQPCDLNERLVSTDRVDDLMVQRYLWWSQEGIFNHGILFSRMGGPEEKKSVTIAVWDDGCLELKRHYRRIRDLCSENSAVLVVDVSGVGMLTPNPINSYPMHDFYGTIFKLACDLFWLGDSLAAMRVYDVTRALDFVQSLMGNACAIRILSVGRQGSYGVLAGFIDPRVAGVERSEALHSYHSLLADRYYDPHDILSLVIPGILDHADLDGVPL